jgi:hypothetical protein
MQCTRPNRPHQKKKQPAIADCTYTVAEVLSTHVSIVLTRVSVPAEAGSYQSSVFTHVHKGPVSKYSLMSTKDQYRSPNSSTKRRHTQVLIVLQMPQTTK